MPDKRPRKTQGTPPDGFRIVEVVARIDSRKDELSREIAELQEQIRDLQEKIGELNRLFRK
jgi:prefoldin subunit 5